VLISPRPPGQRTSLSSTWCTSYCAAGDALAACTRATEVLQVQVADLWRMESLFYATAGNGNAKKGVLPVLSASLSIIALTRVATPFALHLSYR
jgi:hypothetical protein